MTTTPVRMGFFTDTSVCIGCKACEVACKEWNLVPDRDRELSGRSYDNTLQLDADNWRHVAFIEQTRPIGVPAASRRADGLQIRWLMSSDVCKHCTEAGCLDVCPTGSLFRTEFGTVVVQEDICNGCGYCVPACPFGVIDRREDDGRAWKCTLCYDRLRGDLEPACAQACPTELDPVRAAGRAAPAGPAARSRSSHAGGVEDARLYGEQPDDGVGGAGAFFLLLDEPDVYGLPPDPVVPTRTGARHVGPRRPRQRRAGGRHCRRRDTGAAMSTWSSGSPEPGYYGAPIVKPAPWKNEIAGYFFTGGLAGALVGPGDGRSCARASRTLPATPATGRWPASLPSPVLLDRRSRSSRPVRQHAPGREADVADERGELAADRLRHRRRRAAAVAGAICTGCPGSPLVCSTWSPPALGSGLATYTAVLVADTATPVWHESRRTLPLLFAASAAAERRRGDEPQHPAVRGGPGPCPGRGRLHRRARRRPRDGAPARSARHRPPHGDGPAPTGAPPEVLAVAGAGLLAFGRRRRAAHAR